MTKKIATPIFLLILIVVFPLALLWGRYPSVGFLDVKLLFTDPVAFAVFFNSRLPRAIAALLLGAILAATGNAFQMIFGSPLVEPGFLGVSHGAALGAAIAIVLGSTMPGLIQVSAFLFAIAALIITLLFAKSFKAGGYVLRLLLSGIAVSAFLQAGVAFVKYIADPVKELPDIVFWTMGSLSQANWIRLYQILPLTIICLVTLFAFKWRLNILALDDAQAHSLGAHPKIEKAIVILVCGAGVAAVTSLAGIVSWAGLIVPQFSRSITGSDARYSMPLCMILGALFMLFCDTISRSLLPGELPLGITTAFLGSIAFIVMLNNQKVKVVR